MSTFTMAEAFAYFILIAIFLAALPFVIRSTKRSAQAAPAAAIRSPRQRALNLGSGLLLMPVLAYFAFASEIGAGPFVALLLSFTFAMLLLRLAHVPWKVRVALTPVVAALSVIPGVAVVGEWVPSQPSTMSSAVWLPLAAASVVVALSGVLSIVSFPNGYGERSN